MTPAQLRAIGEALYGPRWQSEIAGQLGVADRTVRRWLAGERKPEPGVADELRAIGRQRIAQIEAAIS